MFSHVMIGTRDLEQARQFYDAVLATLSVPPRPGKHQSHWAAAAVLPPCRQHLWGD